MPSGTGSNNMNVFLSGRLNVAVSFKNIEKDIKEIQKMIDEKGISLKISAKLAKSISATDVSAYVKEIQEKIKNISLKVNLGLVSKKEVTDGINKSLAELKPKALKLIGSLNTNETAKRISEEMKKVEEKLEKRPLKLTASVNGVNFNSKKLKEAATGEGGSNASGNSTNQTPYNLNKTGLLLNREVKKFYIKDGEKQLSSKISEFAHINDKFKGVKVIEDADGNIRAIDEIIDKAKKAKHEAQEMVKAFQMGRNIDFSKQTRDLSDLLKQSPGGISEEAFKVEAVNKYMDELSGVSGRVKNLKFDYDETGKTVAKFGYEIESANGKVYSLNYNLDLSTSTLKQEEKVSVRTAKAKKDLSNATDKQLKGTRQLTDAQEAYVKELQLEGKILKDVQKYKVDRSGKYHLAGGSQTFKMGYETAKVTTDADGRPTDVRNSFDYEKEAKDILKDQVRIKNMGVLIKSAADDPNLKRVVDSFKSIKTAGDLEGAKKSLADYVKQVHGANASLEKFNIVTDATGREIVQLESKIDKGKGVFQKVQSNIDLSNGEMRQAPRSAKGNELTRNLGFMDILARGAKWFAVLKTINIATQGMQMFFDSIRQVDTAMVELRKVTNETAQTYRDFGLEAGRIGKTVAKSAAEVIQSTAEFARLGYTLEQAKKLAQNALLLSNVSELDAVESSKTIVSAVKGFGIEIDAQGKNVQKVVDIYNEIGNNYAISTAGIASAIERSAASLHEAGNTIEESVSLATAANAVVQDPEQVGTALKTIAMRIRGISEEGDDLSTEMIPQLEASFNRIGLTIKASEDSFKSTFQIMRELAGVWDKLSEFDKADILERVAGKRQGNIVAAMLNNWQDAEDALESAHNSTNSASRENEKALDSIDAKIKLLIGSFQNLSNTIADSSFVKLLLDMLIKATDLFTLLIDKVGTTQLVFAALAIRQQNLIPKLAEALKLTFASSLPGASEKRMLEEFAGGVTTTDMAIKGATASTAAWKAVLMSMGIGVAIAGLGFLIQKTIQYAEANAKAVKETKLAVDAYSDQRESIKKLADEYTTLKNATELSRDQQERLVNVQNRLANLLPQLKIGTDENGNAIIRSAEETRKYLLVLDDLEKEAYKARKESIYEQLQKDLKGLNGEIKKQIDLEKEIADREERKKKSPRGTIAPSGPQIAGPSKDQFDFVEDLWGGGSANQRLVTALKTQNDMRLKFLDNFRNMVNLYEQQNDLVANISEKSSEFIANKLLSSDTFKNLNELTDEQIDNTLRNVVTIRRLIADAEEALRKPLGPGETFKDRREETLKALNEELSKLMQNGVKTGQIKDIMDFFRDFAEKYRASLSALSRVDRILNDAYASIIRNSKEFIDNNTLLADSMKTLKEGGELSYGTIMGLIEKYKPLMKDVYVTESGQLKIKLEALEKIAKLSEEEHENEIQRKIDEIEMEKRRLEAVGNQLLAEMNYRQKINDIRKQGVLLTKTELKMMRDEIQFQKSMGDDPTKDASLKGYLDGTIKEVDGILKGLDRYDADIADYKKFLENLKKVNEIDAMGADNSKKDSKFKPFEFDSYENADKALANKIKINQFLADSIRDKMTNMDGTVNQDMINTFRDAINSEIELYKQRQDLAHQEAENLRERNRVLEGQFSGMANSEEKNDLMKEYQDNINKIYDLQDSWLEFATSIRDLTEAEKENIDTMKSYNAEIKNFQNELESLKDSQEDLNTSSKQYRDNLGEQLIVLKNMQVATQSEIDSSNKRIQMYKDMLANGDLVQEQRKMILELMQQEEEKVDQLSVNYKEFGKQIKESNKEIANSNKEWISQANKLADDIISTIKKSIEKEKEEAIASIDEVTEKRREAHEERIKQIEEDSKKFEDAINKQISLIEKQEESRDFKKSLDKEVKEKNRIQSEIDKLRLDNSIEAKAKIAELEKQLADQTEKIDEMNHKREVDLRKDNLKDQLDTNRKETDDLKNQLEKQFDEFVKMQDNKKKKIEYDAKEMLDNEARWAKIREDILHGNIEALRTELEGYWKTFTDLANENSKKAYRDINANLSLANDLLQRLNEIKNFDYGSMPNAGADLGNGDQFGGGGPSTGGPAPVGGTPSNPGGTGTLSQEFQDEQKYLKNKTRYFEIMMKTGESMNAEQKALSEENAKLRSKYAGNPKFADFNKDQLIQMNPYGFADMATKFRKYIKNKLDWTGANEATRKLLTKENEQLRSQYGFQDFTLDDIARLGLASFNGGGYTGDWSSNDGKIGLLHRKEQIFDEDDTQRLLMAAKLVRDITPLIKTLFYPKNENANTTSGVNIENITLHVASLNGDKKGAQLVLDTLVEGLKEKGVKI